MTYLKSESDAPEILSQPTRELLAKAGWTPKYRGPVSLYSAAYRYEGLTFSHAANKFLSHFGGLVIRYPTKTLQDDALEFRADRAAKGSGDGALTSYEEMAQAHPLCPIGSYSFGMCMLLMDAKGRVYGGTEWSLSLIGQTGEEAIEKILTGAPIETIEEIEG